MYGCFCMHVCTFIKYIYIHAHLVSEMGFYLFVNWESLVGGSYSVCIVKNCRGIQSYVFWEWDIKIGKKGFFQIFPVFALLVGSGQSSNDTEKNSLRNGLCQWSLK